MLKLCDCCGIFFDRKPSQLKRAKFSYCSLECRNRHYKIARIGQFNPAWKGGRVVRKDGYIEIYQPWHPNANVKGYMLEHRLVMEKKIGRELLQEEVIHHKNHNPSDNRIENLELTIQAIHITKHINNSDRTRDEFGKFI